MTFAELWAARRRRRPWPDRPRHRGRRPGLRARQHPPRVHDRRPGGASIGAIVVPVYPTNSPDECQWVVGDSGATPSSARRPSTWPRSTRCAPSCRRWRTRSSSTARPRAPRRSPTSRPRGAGGDEAELDRRAAGGRSRRRLPDHLHVGHHRASEGRRADQRGFAAGRRSADEMELFGLGDVVYLYLPLAHVFAQLIQADCVEVGATIAYLGGDTTQIVAELGAVQPTVLPSVPRVFEKVYAVAMAWSRRRRGRRPGGDRARAQGAPGPRAGRGRARRGGGGVREGGRRDVRPRPRHLRWPDQVGHVRGGADRPRDPGVLLRRRRAR